MCFWGKSAFLDEKYWSLQAYENYISTFVQVFLLDSDDIILKTELQIGYSIELLPCFSCSQLLMLK